MQDCGQEIREWGGINEQGQAVTIAQIGRPTRDQKSLAPGVDHFGGPDEMNRPIGGVGEAGRPQGPGRGEHDQQGNEEIG